jgi:hypothetical protein
MESRWRSSRSPCLGMPLVGQGLRILPEKVGQSSPMNNFYRLLCLNVFLQRGIWDGSDLVLTLGVMRLTFRAVFISSASHFPCGLWLA